MFEKFSDPARKVIFLSREEAEKAGQKYINLEHLLLGILRLASNAKSQVPGVIKVFEKKGLSIQKVQKILQSNLETSPEPNLFGEIPFGEKVKEALSWAIHEIEKLQKAKIIPDYIFLGILKLAHGDPVERTVKVFKFEFEEAREIIFGEEYIKEKLKDKKESKPSESAPEPPSAKVHSDDWTIEDNLGYGLYGFAVSEFIRHPDTKPPFVISIQAPWGQGKTSLMRMIQQNLDPNHSVFMEPSFGGNETHGNLKKNTKSFLFKIWNCWIGIFQSKKTSHEIPKFKNPTIWFNAWNYQSHDQLWAGLAHCILSQLTERISDPIAKERFWLTLELNRVNPEAIRRDIYASGLSFLFRKFLNISTFCFGFIFLAGIYLINNPLLFDGSLGNFSNVGYIGSGSAVLFGFWKSLVAKTKIQTEFLAQHIQKSYFRYLSQPSYAAKLGFLHVVERDMQKAFDLLVDDQHPAVIFVDDLDRCMPEKIGQVIEALNLFLAANNKHCIFVLGIDADIVAASMEVVHEKILGRLRSRKSELGWRFLDKFVQLSIVIPQLSQEQQGSFLDRLLVSVPAENSLPRAESETESASKNEAQEVLNQLKQGKISSDQAVDRVGKIGPELANVAPMLAKELAKLVVKQGAKKFTDQDPEMVGQLKKISRYFSGNPRLIKRIINLYRFHRFASWARQSSQLGLPGASPSQIARWVVPIVRWPNFIRWIQVTNQFDAGNTKGNTQLKTVIELAGKSTSTENWAAEVNKQGIDPSGWENDRDLWQFLREKIPNAQELVNAPRFGFW